MIWLLESRSVDMIQKHQRNLDPNFDTEAQVIVERAYAAIRGAPIS